MLGNVARAKRPLFGLAASAALALAGQACGSSRAGFSDEEPPAPSPDAGDAQAESAAPVADAGTPPPSFGDGAVTGTRCEREVKMGSVSMSSSACFVNEHVSNRTTKLSFACSGGSVTADFGGHVFKGTVAGDTLSLSDVEKFMFNNCQWESTETINGDLSKGTLTYGYSEKPVVSCPDQPCTANGTVSVTAGAVVVVK